MKRIILSLLIILMIATNVFAQYPVKQITGEDFVCLVRHKELRKNRCVTPIPGSFSLIISGLAFIFIKRRKHDK